MQLDQKTLNLIAAFHSLAHREIRTDNDLASVAQNASNSSGTRAAARFILHVVHPSSNPLYLYDSWGKWDNDQRAAWKAWAADPWWC